MTTAATSVDDVLALVDRWGGHRYDESVAQRDHALQVAALALRDGADDAVVAAALLHDVGHLLALAQAAARPPSAPAGEPARGAAEAEAGGAEAGGAEAGGAEAGGADPTDIGGPVRFVAPHEVTGPAYLAGLFPTAVTGPIARHVAAKRYLCAVDPGYHAGLSPGSVRSLRRQGGPFDPDEVAAFASEDGWRAAVALRRWDDAGKVEGLAVPRLDEFAPLLHALARPAPGA